MQITEDFLTECVVEFLDGMRLEFMCGARQRNFAFKQRQLSRQLAYYIREKMNRADVHVTDVPFHKSSCPCREPAQQEDDERLT